MLDAEVFVDHLYNGREAVRGSGSSCYKALCAIVEIVAHPKDEVQCATVLHRGRNDDLLHSAGIVGRELGSLTLRLRPHFELKFHFRGKTKYL